MVLDLVILEKRHVAAVEPGGPRRRRARQPHIEQAAAAACQAAFAPVGSLVPPAAAIPRVGRKRKQTARWRHRLEIERHSGAMQIHGGFQ